MTPASDLDALAERAFAPVAAAVAAGRVPGAVFGLVTADGARAARVAGAAVLVPEVVPMRRETVFDLASLTKVIFTTRAILAQVDAGQIALDDPLARAIPDLRQYDVANAAERRLTFRQCLAHRTFLPAVEPLYTLAKDAATLRAYVLQRAFPHGPPVYSDINFILLGIALERLTGKALGEQAPPPGFTWRPDPATCAATEACTWRGRLMRGEVHDENAFAMGGASGHAGLFGTLDALLDVARGMLDGSGLAPWMAEALAVRESDTRTLGWEMTYPGWSGGDTCAPTTIGHTGFTGTGLWTDRARGIAWSLLTNRVHPSRHVDTGIVALRREVGAIVGAFA
jgi:CubicO group peptidase (beta-lactamase class C family)